VSYQDALDYVAWLSSREKGKTYRLPTEAEWEYAARAQSEFTLGFEGGRARLCEFANGADQDIGVLSGANLMCSDHVGREVAQVEFYKSNLFGLHDMLGNVWEWTSDCWFPSHDGHVKGEGGEIDASKPREAKDGPCASRVVKGGSWRSGPDALRPAARNTFPPGHSRGTLGFRVVRVLAEGE
jgi:formylglycine-generating enzyme required for sulfatase activity